MQKNSEVSEPNSTGQQPCMSVEHLTKRYGDFTAVRDLSFTIEEGHVYGFLGPNGAGKSTTMNIMTGCLSATEGRVLIGGHDIYEEPQEAKKLIGYLPEQPPLYMSETPAEYLRFVGEAKGLRGAELHSQIEETLEQTGLEHVRDQIIATLSKGYKQRVGIAQALLGSPKIIILDEPTVGLDPIQIIEIRDLIRKLGESHTVILSSHILSEVQAVCSQILIISHGVLTAFDTPENLEALLARSSGVDLQVLATGEQAEGVLQGCGIPSWKLTPEKDTVRISVQCAAEETQELSRRLATAFAEAKLPVLEMGSKKASLEDVFIELTDQGAAAPEEEAPEGEDEE